jgi:hypothetical protein
VYLRILEAAILQGDVDGVRRLTSAYVASPLQLLALLVVIVVSALPERVLHAGVKLSQYNLCAQYSGVHPT